MGEGKTVETTRAARRIIERPRLTRLLTESESRVMLLVAPAGYGKTTLAREWLAQGDREHAWYQVTPAASDVAALGLGLAKSAADVVSAAGDRLPARLRTVGDVSTPEQARSLAEGLAADLSAWPREVVLVIDDYHLLAGNEAADAFVETFVEGTAMPVLVASRTRPSWVTAKRLLYGDAIELGRNVLAMTHTEAAEALADTHDEMPGLVALAEGWPAVIGLAALVSSPVDALSAGVPETLHEFFADELYHALDADSQWRLAELSIAPAIDDRLAHALFGHQSHSVLDDACRSGFLTRTTGSYEMHPLLRQFLRVKLGAFEAQRITTSAETIARSYAEAKRWDEAVTVAAEFELFDVGLRVLDEALDALLSEGRIATLRKWLNLARAYAPTAPIVSLAAIEIDFRNGDWTAAKGKANRLVRAIPDDNPLASRVFLRAGQIAHLDDRPQDALELLAAAKRQARSPQELRNALSVRFLTLADLEEREEALAALRDLEELPSLSTDDILRAGQGRLDFAARWGPIVETLQAVSSLIDLVDESSDPIVRTGFLQTFGSALAFVARYEEAKAIAERQIAEAERYELEWVLPHALEMRATAQTGTRQFSDALKTLARARRLADEQGSLHLEVNGLALIARVHLSRGSAERAVQILETRRARFTSPGMEGDYRATYALALACCGRTRESLTLIDASESVSSHIDGRAIRDFARALAGHFDVGTMETGLVRNAFQTVLDTGSWDAFVCAYRAFPPLLTHLVELECFDTTPFADKIAMLDPGLGEKIGLRTRGTGAETNEPLTPREREVLELVRQGLSNRQIAKTLWITESTVKVHVRHLFAKMGVRSRTEAAALSLKDH
ncbi:MAG: LuxR C-terminal-related transcriptional regulator [Gaiellaceae bacterium]